MYNRMPFVMAHNEIAMEPNVAAALVIDGTGMCICIRWLWKSQFVYNVSREYNYIL